VAGEDGVRTVERASRNATEHERCRPCERRRPEELHAPGAVSGDATVGRREVPALATLILGQGGEEPCRLRVVQGQERELVATVEPCDDTRREPAEPSACVVQEHRALDHQPANR